VNFDWRTASIIIGIIILVMVIAAAQFLKREPAEIGTVALDDDRTDNERREVKNESY